MKEKLKEDLTIIAQAFDRISSTMSPLRHEAQVGGCIAQVDLAEREQEYVQHEETNDLVHTLVEVNGRRYAITIQRYGDRE